MTDIDSHFRNEGDLPATAPEFISTSDATTTLLGFASLLVATARPLRELGIAGCVGTLTALAGV